MGTEEEEKRIKYEVFADILGHFESLQFLVVSFIGLELGDTALAEELFNDMSFGRIREIFKKIAHYKIRDESILAELDEIASDLKDAGEKRNEVAHSGIAEEMNEEDSIVIRKFIYSKKKERFLEELDINVLREYDKAISSTYDKLFHMIDKLFWHKPDGKVESP